MKIIDSNAYTLEKIANTNKYTLYIKGEYKEQLYESLINLLPNVFYDEYDNKIIFLATSVMRIALNGKTCEKNEKIVHMINTLTNQMETLRMKSRLFFYGLDLTDILVINKNIFIIVNTNNLIELDKCQKATFTNPFELPYFSSPELLEIKSLPAEIDYRASYYSLGALIIYYLTNEYLFIGNEVMREANIEKCLQPLLNTKVYWFLKRCIKSKCEERILLFI